MVYRTKDSAWVYGALDHSVPEALAFAEEYGQQIRFYIHKVQVICLNKLSHNKNLFYRLIDPLPSSGIVLI